jgi:diacylglycerol kinase family enzyme
VGEILHGKDVTFAILPAGSANGLSVDLDFPTDLDSQLTVAFGSETKEIDMICINGTKSLHLSDIGLNAELIKNYENGSIRGKLGYMIQAVNTMADVELPFRAHITTENGAWDTEAKMVVMANSQKYGTGVTINPNGKPDDGKFEIVIIRNLDWLLFGKIVVGKMPLDTGEIEIISTESAVIETDVPVHFQVDGEYCGEETRLEISVLPRQMRLAVPRPEKDGAGATASAARNT